MIPAIAIIFTFYVSREHVGRSDTSWRTLCFHCARTWSLLSTCHMQSTWYCHALHGLTHTISRIFCHQSKKATSFCKCFAARHSTLLCTIILQYLISCVCRLLCHHLYTINALLPNNDYLFSILQAPVSFSWCFGISFSAFLLRITSLTLLLNAGWRCWKTLILPRGTGFPNEDCLICPLSPLLAHLPGPNFGSEMALLARTAPSFAGSTRCAVIFPKNLLLPIQFSLVPSCWLVHMRRFVVM